MGKICDIYIYIILVWYLADKIIFNPPCENYRRDNDSNYSQICQDIKVCNQKSEISIYEQISHQILPRLNDPSCSPHSFCCSILLLWLICINFYFSKSILWLLHYNFWDKVELSHQSNSVFSVQPRWTTLHILWTEQATFYCSAQLFHISSAGFPSSAFSFFRSQELGPLSL